MFPAVSVASMCLAVGLATVGLADAGLAAARPDSVPAPPPDATPPPLPHAAPPPPRATRAGTDSTFGRGSDSLAVGDSTFGGGLDTLAVADSLEDLDAVFARLQAARATLGTTDRAVFDELLAAAREMAAASDSDSARLLVGDLRHRLEAAARAR